MKEEVKKEIGIGFDLDRLHTKNMQLKQRIKKLEGEIKKFQAGFDKALIKCFNTICIRRTIT